MVSTFALVVSALGSVVISQPAHAVALNVTAGVVDETDNGNCSLYEAIEAANADAAVDACPAGSGVDTINIPAGTYVMNDRSYGLNLDSDMIFQGMGAASDVIFDARYNDNGGYNVEIDPGVNDIEIRNFTIKDGSTCIHSRTEDHPIDILIENVVVDNCKGSGYDPPGMYLNGSGSDIRHGSLTLNNVEVKNTSGEYGGGVEIKNYETLTIDGGSVHDTTTSNTNDYPAFDVENIVDISINNMNIYNNTGYAAIVSYRKSGVFNDFNIFNNEPVSNAAGGAFQALIADTIDPSFSYTNSYVTNNKGEFAVIAGNDGSGYEANINNLTISNNETVYSALTLMSDENTPLEGSVSNLTIADNTRLAFEDPQEEGPQGMAVGIIVASMSGVQPTAEFKNILLSNNTDNGEPQNCGPDMSPFKNFESAGYNLSSDTTCTSVLDQSSDLNSTSPALQALSDVDGTKVRPLDADSAAVDAGVAVEGVTTDQRGATRPAGSAPDIGAYEYGASADGPDTDGDGVSDAEEDGVAQNDGNGDSINDSEQAFVCSFRSTTGEYVTIAINENSEIHDCRKVSTASTGVSDSSFEFPVGFAGFTATELPDDAKIDVSVFYHDLNDSAARDFVLRKHDSEQSTAFTVAGAVLEDVNVGGLAVIKASYSIEDGSALDSDGEVNGTIVDPIGLASGSLAYTGVLAAVAVFFGGSIIAIVAVTYYSYLRHRAPLRQEEPGIKYGYFHYVRYVTIPGLKYRISISKVPTRHYLQNEE